MTDLDTSQPVAPAEPPSAEPPAAEPPAEPPAAERPSAGRPWLAATTGWVARNRMGLTLFVLSWLVLLFWWAAYFPGLFSPDSFAYMWQATTSHWDTHHSVLYNGLVWVSLYTTGGIATLTFLQTLGTAASLAYAATALRRLGAPSWLLLPLGVGVVALPTIGTFVVCLWKDVPYTIAMIFALGTVCRLVELRLRQRPVATRLLVLLGGELLVICLMRPNGFAAVAGFGVLASCVLVGTRLRVLAVAGAAVVISLAANLLVFPAMGVRNSLFDASSLANYHDIAVVYDDHPEAFTPADLDLLRTVGPLESWRAGSGCVTLDTLVGSPGWSFARAELRSADLNSLWLRLLRAEPAAVLDARLCRAAVIWKPWRTGPDDWMSGPPITGYASFLSDDIRQSPFFSAIYSDPLSDRLHRYAVKWEKAFSGVVAETIEWRGSFWSYLTYLALLVAFIRRRRLELLAIGALTAANQLTLLPQTPGPGARYMFPPIMLGALAVTIAFARTPGADVVGEPPLPNEPNEPDERERGEPEPVPSSVQARLDERG